MAFLAQVAIWGTLFFAWRIRRAAMLLNHIIRPLESHGWWTAAAAAVWVQDGIAKVAEWMAFHSTPPGMRDDAIAYMGTRMAAHIRTQMNSPNGLVTMQCRAAFSGYAWTPAGVAALTTRRYPGALGSGVAAIVRENLEMWSTHHPGVFEER